MFTDCLNLLRDYFFSARYCNIAAVTLNDLPSVNLLTCHLLLMTSLYPCYSKHLVLPLRSRIFFLELDDVHNALCVTSHAAFACCIMHQFANLAQTSTKWPVRRFSCYYVSHCYVFGRLATQHFEYCAALWSVRNFFHFSWPAAMPSLVFFRLIVNEKLKY